MSDNNKTGKPPSTKTSNRNITNTFSKTPIVKNIPTNVTKQIHTYTKSSISKANPSSNESNSNVLVAKSHTLPPLPLSTSTSATTSALRITTAANQHDNLSTSDNQNVIAFNNDNAQPHSVSSSEPPTSFATITANDKTPSREQAIVFNSIDGIRQIEYILAIGKLIPPRNILFTSRISNNRFCIFLSSKDALDTLLENTKTLSINDHTIPIRRLINPAKKITISNVCPSIPNVIILNALKNINITPVSQINYLKAGINIEGYEHILSFRRQMFINQEDVIKLPGSLVINFNQTSFRIFFTDDRITCFLCKAVGHTSASCTKHSLHSSTTNTQIRSNSPTTHRPIATNEEHTSEFLEDIQIPELPPIDASQPQSIMDWSQENNDKTLPLPIANTKTSYAITETPTPVQAKRPLSDTNSPKTPTSPTVPGSPTTLVQPEKKKPKPSALDQTLSPPPTTTKSTPRFNLQSPSSVTARKPQSPWTSSNTFWKILEILTLTSTHYAMKSIPTLRTCLI